MNNHQDDQLHDPDENDIEDAEKASLNFHDFVQVCPACKHPITPDMDSCPYCGDILFRHLRDGMFAPRKGPLVKLLAVLIILLVTLALAGMLLQLILH